MLDKIFKSASSDTVVHMHCCTQHKMKKPSEGFKGDFLQGLQLKITYICQVNKYLLDFKMLRNSVNCPPQNFQSPRWYAHTACFVQPITQEPEDIQFKDAVTGLL